MNNLQFIATYIHNNPDNATFTSIRTSLMLWKGFTVEECIERRGQYTRYFSRGDYPLKYRYHGRLWKKADLKSERSSYVLTEIGKKYVVNTEEKGYNKNV
jgi:hypothetical protein